MADDEMAVLLQQAIAELQATRKQTEALMAQNKELVEQNSDLTGRVKDMMEGQERRKQNKRKVEVSIHTKVFTSGKGKYGKHSRPFLWGSSVPNSTIGVFVNQRDT